VEFQKTDIMLSSTVLFSLTVFAVLAVCHGLKEHTGKLLFHSADNDPRDNEMTLIEVQRFFLLFDLNGDGDIKANEFVLAWKQHFQLSDKEAQGMLKLVDTMEPKKEITEMEITAIYNKMDVDNTGSVTLGEFLDFWEDLGAKIDNLPDDVLVPKTETMIRRRVMYKPNVFRRVLEEAHQNLIVKKMYKANKYKKLI